MAGMEPSGRRTLLFEQIVKKVYKINKVREHRFRPEVHTVRKIEIPGRDCSGTEMRLVLSDGHIEPWLRSVHVEFTLLRTASP
jgi:hypothetical protein